MTHAERFGKSILESQRKKLEYKLRRVKDSADSLDKEVGTKGGYISAHLII